MMMRLCFDCLLDFHVFTLKISKLLKFSKLDFSIDFLNYITRWINIHRFGKIIFYPLSLSQLFPAFSSFSPLFHFSFPGSSSFTDFIVAVPTVYISTWFQAKSRPRQAVN